MNTITFRNDVLPLKNELYRLALRITQNPAEAEDVVQDTMVKVWNRRDRWSAIDSMEAFCLTICRNLALDRLKSKANQTENLDDSPEPMAAGNPFEQAQQRDRVGIVRGIINSLPEKQRSCMQLRDVEGRSYKEIAAVMGISEEQVKVNIFRARQTVRQRFKKLDEYGL